MSADALLRTWSSAARTRSAANDVVTWLPLVIAAAVASGSWWGTAAAIATAVAGLAILAAAASRRSRRYDPVWFARQLDEHRADMEDSAALLLDPDAALGPLQQLQRARLQIRLESGSEPDFRPAWSTGAVAASWLAGTLAVLALLFWPTGRHDTVGLAPSAEGVQQTPGLPRLAGQRLRIEPPAYTGLPARNEAGLDTKAPAGSRLTWTFRFAPQPSGARLALHDGASLPARRAGENWTVRYTLVRSVLYRVVANGADSRVTPPLHRLNAVADAPPEIKVVAPDRTLTLIKPGQRRWPLRFDVTDDYGVAPTARLRIILAQGEGENITFRERTITVRGSGSARKRRFEPVLNLSALGFTKGGDLVAQLVVADNRAPGPQAVRSPSLILRWPADLGAEGVGLEGMAKKTLPAYFRSQRQIIIDAEALIKERRRLTAERFVARSDLIGVDQRLLRLRYGQFLGEESEGENKPPPTSDANVPADAHDAAPTATPTFGASADVVAEYGHTHDVAEAATLLDPGTRATLKKALDNMWQSELNLRQGQPQRALPYAYKALGFIKQVQQATRIFLARVGPELPPIDETRRMTGKREGLANRQMPLLSEDGADAVPAAAWRALADIPGTLRTGFDLGTLERWVGDNANRLSDPLALTSAIDAVRREPSCASCRRALRGLLWQVLARPPVQPARREPPKSAGRRYLDVLGSSR